MGRTHRKNQCSLTPQPTPWQAWTIPLCFWGCLSSWLAIKLHSGVKRWSPLCLRIWKGWSNDDSRFLRTSDEGTNDKRKKKWKSWSLEKTHRWSRKAEESKGERTWGIWKQKQKWGESLLGSYISWLLSQIATKSQCQMTSIHFACDSWSVGIGWSRLGGGSVPLGSRFPPGTNGQSRHVFSWQWGSTRQAQSKAVNTRCLLSFRRSMQVRWQRAWE